MANGITTIVFDLDGTIYQNFSFHKDYFRFLLEDTGKEAWYGSLVGFSQDVFAGRRLVMNAFYRNDAVRADTPEEYFRLLGGALAPEAHTQGFPPREKYTYLGDAWALVTFVGLTLGLLEGERRNLIYKKTRDKMESDGMRGDARLRDAIIRAGKRYETVLLSNSYEATARAFLSQLGFEGVFDRQSFSADKPYGLVEALGKLSPRALAHPETVLAVGDHAFNDLAPLRALGCRTLWVNPYEGINEPPHDESVKTLNELAAYLNALCAR
ncbi:MAG: haloacid dehalogenase-like hydrolase [Firmicutes bacterium ADurb.Bin248]|nr:MAG: haloacid dehalogenase-like hydrolase [Firmicutes bacterium ADurb.Bin248]HPK15391.1 HAD family hydrolase [Clostridia bacterium]